jgi:error-prone DNA polymerase
VVDIKARGAAVAWGPSGDENAESGHMKRGLNGWGAWSLSWSEIEARLSGRYVDVLAEDPEPVLLAATPAAPRRDLTDDDYVELHAHSNYSFLDGVSHPEELVVEAARLGLPGLALTDHDGLYGVVKFAQAARDYCLHTIFGAELSLGLPAPQNGEEDPFGQHLVVLARGPAGYAALAEQLTAAQLAGEKGRPVYDLEAFAAGTRGKVMVLTGCRKGAVSAALHLAGAEAARRELTSLTSLFGGDSVVVELIDHDQPLDDERNDALAALAREAGLPVVATNNVHYAAPGHHSLAVAAAAVRARRSMAELDPWLPAAGTAHLRTAAEMRARFHRHPGAVAQSVAIARDCAFDLALIAPTLPAFEVPPGETEDSWLRHLATLGMRRRYGPPEAAPTAYAQLEKELSIVREMGFPGYFLVVHSITEFCRERGILCQGRGSSANSIICYALGVTNADPIAYGLLFERFLSPERDGPPDIDVDIESARREEVIQYLFEKYGRLHTAQVANVISYRSRSAVRDAAKALGYSPGQQDAWSKQIDRDGAIIPRGDEPPIPEPVLELAHRMQDAPRHLGIHSGGMVICDRPVGQVVPIEWARMENRSVLQWDKDDCAAVGLTKFDLLGLGMLGALHHAFDFLGEVHGDQLDLAAIPPDDPSVYAMIQAADTIGVFQIESRAQMASLPRLKPSTFYDLVVEVALIRPGPIQGNAVHPFIRRATGREPVVFDHPLLEPALAKTKGVPLFQEQLLQMAIDVAGFSAADADALRRAISSKRSAERMAALRARFYAGMAEREITGELADKIWHQVEAFANYGFPESHAISFAYLAYASCYLKRYYPAAFTAALLKANGERHMGFYSPQTLVTDARRHGVTIEGPDINRSTTYARLEAPGPLRPAPAEAPPAEWGRGGPRIRLGLSAVRTIGADLADQLVAERDQHGPYQGFEDLARRCGLSPVQLEALATAGAFTAFDPSRREALWTAGAAALISADQLPGTTPGLDAPPLPSLSALEVAAADLWATGVTPGLHPVELVRRRLTEAGAVTAAELRTLPTRTRAWVGGVVTHRQRPRTAGGVIFMSLEDETGTANVICSPGLWKRYRSVARHSRALLVRGLVENAEGVTNLLADHCEPFSLGTPVAGSRDFR